MGNDSPHTDADDARRRAREDPELLKRALAEAGADVANPHSIKCPFHDDNHPSAGIYEDIDGVRRFKCHGCDAAGDVFDIVQKSRGVSFGEATQIVSEWMGIPGPQVPANARPGSANNKPKADLATLAKQYQSVITVEQIEALAAQLGVTVTSLRAVGVGWRESDQSFTFPEVNGKGKVVGIVRRFKDGSKRALPGSTRGLTVPDGFNSRLAPVLIVEGPTDVCASVTVGVSAVGRPSATGGVMHLAEMFHDTEMTIIGENDEKSGGSWPGRDGALKVASQLTAKWNRPVRVAFPPDGIKDVRAWVAGRGLDFDNDEQCVGAGEELLAILGALAETVLPAIDNGNKNVDRSGDSKEAPDDRSDKDTRSTADRLVALASNRYDFGISPDAQPFAILKDGPRIARMLRGEASALRATLASEYVAVYRKTPNSSALADALLVLHGIALQAEPTPVYLRVAPHADGVVLDLGTPEGHAVVIRPDGWEVVDQSPVLFRRTELTGTLTTPVHSGDLERLRAVLNVDDSAWPVLVAWLVLALLPEVAHPIALLTGQQGTGKSTTARLLASVVDPSPAGLRSPPRDVRQWAVSTLAGWVVPIDNISQIPPWFSDCLCRVVTGDAALYRELYANRGLTVMAFRRPVLLTSIDPGALRGDLADRLLLLKLEPFPDGKRRHDADLLGAFERDHASVLGALCTLTSRVLAMLPDVEAPGTPRMLDYAAVLLCVDDVLGTKGYAAWLGQQETIVHDILESDCVADAIQALVATEPEWTGIAKDMLADMAPPEGERLPKDWPESGRGLGGRLRRLMPALKATGIVVEEPDGRSGHNNDRIWGVFRDAS